MRKSDKIYKIFSCVFLLIILILAGCSKQSTGPYDMQPVQESDDIRQEEDLPEKELSAKESSTGGLGTEETSAEEIGEREEAVEPTIMEVDWSDYFDGINGAAVIYDPAENSFRIYNQELALPNNPYYRQKYAP